jgi:hypothetical protein
MPRTPFLGSILLLFKGCRNRVCPAIGQRRPSIGIDPSSIEERYEWADDRVFASYSTMDELSAAVVRKDLNWKKEEKRT